jgi:hypothetical protein
MEVILSLIGCVVLIVVLKRLQRWWADKKLEDEVRRQKKIMDKVYNED